MVQIIEKVPQQKLRVNGDGLRLDITGDFSDKLLQEPFASDSVNEDEVSSPFQADINLVDKCYEYIESDNIESLALIAKQKGIPIHIRYRVWPILLKKHPFVVNPYITPNYDEDYEEEKSDTVEDADKLEDEDGIIPIRQIRNELKRYFRKNLSGNKSNGFHQNLSNSSSVSTSNVVSDPYFGLMLVEKRIFKTMEYAIVKFLKKWGKIFKYEPGLAWIALGLAEWFPPLFNNKHYADQNQAKYVLLGKDTTLSKLEKKFKNKDFSELVASPSSAQYPEFEAFDSDNNSTTSTIIEEKLFFNDPNLGENCCIIDINEEANLHYDNHLQKSENYEKFQQAMEKLDAAVSLKHKMSYPEVYERLVLVLLHAAEPTELKYEQGSNKDKPLPSSIITLPTNGGSSEDRLSFFLHLLRDQFGELFSYLKEEGVLTSNLSLTTNGDEWLMWWIKWSGAKVFNKTDRGRIWDILLGWREETKNITIDESLLEYLGPDVYTNSINTCNGEIADHFKRLLDRENIKFDFKLRFPFSIVNPHIELIFIYLSYLKSQENLLLELEQSEIRQLLNNGLLSTRTRLEKKNHGHQTNTTHKSVVRYPNNVKAVKSPELISGPSSPLKSATKSIDTKDRNIPFLIDKCDDDFEDIILQSGTLWTNWVKKELSPKDKEDVEKV